MRIVVLTALCSALALGTGACADEANEEEVAYTDEATTTGADTGAATADQGAVTAGAGTSTTTTATTVWPTESRIVVEEGVTYRIDPGGARVRLGPNDARIVVEEGVRYRVDPGGTRVRIDDSGAAIDIDADGLEADVTLD